MADRVIQLDGDGAHNHVRASEADNGDLLLEPQNDWFEQDFLYLSPAQVEQLIAFWKRLHRE